MDAPACIQNTQYDLEVTLFIRDSYYVELLVLHSRNTL